MESSNPKRFFGFGWLMMAFLLVVITFANYKHQKFNAIRADVQEYYAYLPALIIHNDIGFGFTADNPKYWHNKIWKLKSPIGKDMGRMSLGMAITYAPFFMLAHVYANVAGIQADGYSLPYQISIIMAGLFYLLAGLYLLGRFLMRFFEANVVIVVLFLVVFGTNLYHLTIAQTGMPHVTGFGLLAAFVYFTAKFYDSSKLTTSLMLGLLYGLITLIRPTGAVVILFFVLYQVGSWQRLKFNFNYLLLNWLAIALFALMVLVVWMPQLLYWKSYAGNWLFFSYGIKDERFFFANPQLINQLFSFRNGWILYTPLVALMFMGFVPAFKYYRGLAIAILVVMAITVYVLSSWWCWWFVSFGNRAYIEFYALLAVPLAILMHVLRKSPTLKTILSVVLVLLVLLNFIQTTKYRKECIHFDSMSREAYWYSFHIDKPDSSFAQSLVQPNYHWAKQGVYFMYDHIYFTGYEGYLEDKMLKDSLLHEIVMKMKSSPITLEMLQSKADDHGISLEEMLNRDAQWVFRKKYNLPNSHSSQNVRK